MKETIFSLMPWKNESKTFDLSVRVHFNTRLHLTYILQGDTSQVEFGGSAGRQDRLWEKTCFECFLKNREGESYYEYNFGADKGWNCFRFDTYRKGKSEHTVAEPEIVTEISGGLMETRVKVDPIITTPMRLGLSAVTFMKNGTVIYWAIQHPNGKPNFHHPESFVVIG